MCVYEYLCVCVCVCVYVYERAYVLRLCVLCTACCVVGTTRFVCVCVETVFCENIARYLS